MFQLILKANPARLAGEKTQIVRANATFVDQNLFNDSSQPIIDELFLFTVTTNLHKRIKNVTSQI
jgi:hypothetical protein